MACTFVVSALVVLPEMMWMIPEKISRHRPTELALACVILYAIARWRAANEIDGRMPVRPSMCNPAASLEALPTLLHGGIPIKSTPGCF